MSSPSSISFRLPHLVDREHQLTLSTLQWAGVDLGAAGSGLGEGEEAGHRGVHGKEGQVAEDGFPVAGDLAEVEEEEGWYAGEHLEEQVVREPLQTVASIGSTFYS